MKNTLNQILTGLIIAIFIGVLVIIFIKPNINMVHHNQYDNGFSKIEIYFLRTSENAYKAGRGSIGHYDFIQANLVKLKRYAEALQYMPAYLDEKDKAELKQKIEKLNQDSEALDANVIEFMRVNSLLNNSKAYFPELVREFKIAEKTIQMKQLLAYL